MVNQKVHLEESLHIQKKKELEKQEHLVVETEDQPNQSEQVFQGSDQKQSVEPFRWNPLTSCVNSHSTHRIKKMICQSWWVHSWCKEKGCGRIGSIWYNWYCLSRRSCHSSTHLNFRHRTNALSWSSLSTGFHFVSFSNQSLPGATTYTSWTGTHATLCNSDGIKMWKPEVIPGSLFLLRAPFGQYGPVAAWGHPG